MMPRSCCWSPRPSALGAATWLLPTPRRVLVARTGQGQGRPHGQMAAAALQDAHQEGAHSPEGPDMGEKDAELLRSSCCNCPFSVDTWRRKGR